MSVENPNFIDELKDRKVIPYFITYLGGCWAIIQLVDWYVTRNMFSPNWTQMVFYALVFIIPAVLVILFAISNKGKKFRSFHYRFIGINLVAAIFLLGFMYKEKPLEKVAEKVLVVNEEGQEEERVIPTQEYNKRVVIFPFAINGTADPQLRTTIPLLAGIDIEQNPAQFVTSALNLKPRYQKYNRDILEEVPFSVKKGIASDMFSDVFITGSIEDDQAGLKGQISCYSSKDGSELFSKEILAKDLYEFADLLTENYLNNIYTRDFHEMGIENYTDLPTRSLITNNPQALDHFIKGVAYSEFDNDYGLAIQELEKSLEIDPNCVECAAQLSNIYLAINNGQKSVALATEAMKGVEALSERQQFRIKSAYYLRNNNMAKAIGLFEMWKKIYPNNLEPYSYLIQFYPLFEGPDKAIEVGKQAVDMGLKGTYLLSIANLLADKGEYDEAISYFNRYAEVYPERAAESTTLGSIYLKAGRFDDAKKHYQDIELLKPQDYNIKKQLAIVERRSGNYTKSERLLNEALAFCNNASDSVDVYRSLEILYQRKGQVEKAFQYVNEREKMMATYLPPIAIAVEVFQNQNLHSLYEFSGRFDDFKSRLNAAKPIFNQPGFYKLIDYIYYQSTENVDSAKLVYDEVRELTKEMSGDNQVIALDITYYHLIGQYDKVIELFNDFEQKSGAVLFDQFRTLRAQTYLKAEQMKEAEKEYLKIYNQYPHVPEILQEMGDLYVAMNQKAKAKEFYEEALTILADADVGFTIKEEVTTALANL